MTSCNCTLSRSALFEHTLVYLCHCLTMFWYTYATVKLCFGTLMPLFGHILVHICQFGKYLYGCWKPYFLLVVTCSLPWAVATKQEWQQHNILAIHIFIRSLLFRDGIFHLTYIAFIQCIHVAQGHVFWSIQHCEKW